MKLNKANVDTESKTNSKTDEPAAQMKKKKRKKKLEHLFPVFSHSICHNFSLSYRRRQKKEAERDKTLIIIHYIVDSSNLFLVTNVACTCRMHQTAP